MKNMLIRFARQSRLTILPTRAVTPAAFVLALTLALGYPSVARASSALDDGVNAYRQGAFEKSAEIFASLAQTGDTTAQYLLSCQTINGVGVPANEEAGWDLMQKAADQQHPDASIIIARKLEANQAPREQIRALYQQAADKDQTQAMLWLALDAMEQGQIAQAKELLEKAWELGDPRAATLLGNRFAKTDVTRFEYLRKAAARGEMRAAAHLADEARALEDTVEAVGWCAIATGLPGHNEDVDWKTIGDAVEKNCGQFDKDLAPEDRAENRERVDQFLARFFKNYEPWTPWRACAVE